MSKVENKEKTPNPVIIKEELSRKLLRSVYAQFSGVSEALLELVDNAFDEFNGFQGGNHLEVDIWLSKKSITVENRGGKGMGANELQEWLKWGDAHKTNAIGEYGQGGKAAMGYLGNSWVVRCKRWDNPWLWEIRENNWDDTSVEHKEYKAIAAKFDGKKDVGYCNFQIRKIKETLANTYRKLLEEGKASITINTDPVSPLSLPLYDAYEIKDFKQKTSTHLLIHGWIGRLKRDVRVKDSPKIKGGMRLLRKGRLIKEEEYFGHHDSRYKASLGTLIGEVELSKVPVLPNKTGFDTDSSDWEEVRKTMYAILKPHIDELLSEREEDTVSREEKKALSEVRRKLIVALALIGKDDIGREKPEKLEGEVDFKPESLQKEQSEKPRKKPDPVTEPPDGAIGKLKRLGKVPDMELHPLGPAIRSAWVVKDDGSRCLRINNEYCLYKLLKDNKKDYELYLAETAAIRLAEPGDDKNVTIIGYIDELDRIVRAFCELMSLKHKNKNCPSHACE